MVGAAAGFSSVGFAGAVAIDAAGGWIVEANAAGSCIGMNVGWPPGCVDGCIRKIVGVPCWPGGGGSAISWGCPGCIVNVIGCLAGGIPGCWAGGIPGCWTGCIPGFWTGGIPCFAPGLTPCGGFGFSGPFFF